MRAEGVQEVRGLPRGKQPALRSLSRSLALLSLSLCTLVANPGHAQLKTNSVFENLKPAVQQAALPAEEAFRFSQFTDASTLRLTWQIAPKHYLYRQKFELTTVTGRSIPFATPQAATITDEFFGETEVYFDTIQLEIPLDSLTAEEKQARILEVIYQGCAKDLYCYPPQHLQISL